METDINKIEERELEELRTPKGCFAIFMAVVIVITIMLIMTIVALVRTYVV